MIHYCPECGYKVKAPSDMSSQQLLKIAFDDFGRLSCPKCNTSIYVGQGYAREYISSLLDSIRENYENKTIDREKSLWSKLLSLLKMILSIKG